MHVMIFSPGFALLSLTAMRFLYDLLNEECRDAYNGVVQLKLAVKSSSGEAHKDLFISKAQHD